MRFDGLIWSICFQQRALRLLELSCGLGYAHIYTHVYTHVYTDEPIHLALLIPFSGLWNMGNRIAGAAKLAVDRINADKALLRGRRLEYIWSDSGCSAQQGLAAMGELLRGASRVNAVIGCSSACEVTSYLSGGQQIPQISFACTAASLSNKKKYSLVRHPS